MPGYVLASYHPTGARGDEREGESEQSIGVTLPVCLHRLDDVLGTADR